MRLRAEVLASVASQNRLIVLPSRFESEIVVHTAVGQDSLASERRLMQIVSFDPTDVVLREVQVRRREKWRKRRGRGDDFCKRRLWIFDHANTPVCHEGLR